MIPPLDLGIEPDVIGSEPAQYIIIIIFKIADLPFFKDKQLLFVQPTDQILGITQI